MDVNEFLLLARSDLWTDRVQAGRGLSAHAGQMTADVVLQELLLDTRDTAVIARTADALLERGDVAAWKVFAAAWMVATPSQADHLSDSLNRTLFEASLDSDKARRITRALNALMAKDDATIRDGAIQLMNRVATALPE